MITYHHIGGRNGTYPLPLKKGILLKDFHLILYDADENCFEQMGKSAHDAWGKVSLYPYCIGEKTERASFNLNFHPTTSSLYRFNEQYQHYNYFDKPQYGDYILGDACRLIRSIDLNLLSLEDALKNSAIPSIDFLSLDVQGAEYDILQGAGVLLKQNCIGIQLEVEFVKLYENQRTFSDINQFLEHNGFELIEMGSLGRCAPITLPIGFRGIEQPLYAEAVYIKKIDHLHNDPSLLLKAALFALIYNKLGLCCHFLERAFQAGWKSDSRNAEHAAYLTLLSELWELYNGHKHIKLPSIAQLYSHKDFQTYYQNGGNTSQQEKENRDPLKNYLAHLLPEVEALYKTEHTPLEKMLKKYALEELAETVQKNRLREAACFMELAQ